MTCGSANTQCAVGIREKDRAPVRMAPIVENGRAATTAEYWKMEQENRHD